MTHDVTILASLFSSLSIAQTALIAAVCVGVSCGLLGSFVVVRRVALVGDALSHAVFPGVVAGFMINEERNPWVIFFCAIAAGLLGIAVVRAVVKSTRLKSDAALGIVLASFFAIGVLWNSTNQQAGVKEFLFGNLAAVSNANLTLMIVSTIVIIALVVLFLRPFWVLSFDEGFAVGLGYPVKILNGVFFGLLAFAVVVAMQAVGVILVSAMLITPAATSYLLTDRLQRMMLYAIGFGVISAVSGWWVSGQYINIAVGPIIALIGAGLFGVVYFFAPQHGVLAKVLRHTRRRSRVHRENTLKAIYRMIESDGFKDTGVSIQELAQVRKMTLEDARKDGNDLVRNTEATWEEGNSAIYLTASGWRRAVEIVRNHRLWELYLTSQANYAADHVHEDAEKIEHVLDADTVRMLERDLNFPELDPHGKPIPSVARTMELETVGGKQPETGY